jgi:diguanylate cyclase (GGDEF)-like protein/PAS domain S-box-containing protein
MGNAARAMPTIGLLLRARADRRILASFLGEIGHPVLAPDQPAAGVQALDGASLIIVDEEAGRECAEALVRLKERVRPVILPILVALPSGADGGGWLRQGFDALLRMPLGKSDLLARIETFLRLRAQSEEALRASEAFSRSALDAIAANICVVDARGAISLANRAWREFSESNDASPALVCEGSSYLEVCRAAAASADATVREPAAAILRVIEGQEHSCAVEYPCHSPTGRRWFIASAVRYHNAEKPFTVVSHTNITGWRESAIAARAAEQRFRSLIELSSDYYWETDAKHRLRSRQTGKLQGTEAQFPASETMGKRRWELPGVQTDGADWESHRAALEAQRPFRGFEFGRRAADGAIRYYSISGEPVLDENGAFAGYRGVGTDITSARREQRLLAMEHSVARSLSEAESASAGLQLVMRSVCDAKGWDCGRYWRLDDARGVLRADVFWSVTDPAIEELHRVRDQDEVAPGEGLTGTAFLSGEPLWVAELAKDPRTLRRELFMAAGLRGACLIPVVSDGQVLGVVNFAGRTVREPDARLRAAMAAIGSQLGQFLQRKRVEENLVRFRAALDVSADAILLVDRSRMRYLDVNQTFCDLVGYAREEVLGMTPMELFSADRETLERDYDAIIADGGHPASRIEGEYRCKNGSRVVVETHRKALRTKEGWIIVASARDMRDRNAQEQALRESNQRLELQAWRQERIARFGQFALKRRSSEELVTAAIAELSNQADAVAMFERSGDGELSLRLAHGKAVEDSIGKSAPLLVDSAAHRVLEGGVSIPMSEAYLAAVPAAWPWSSWMKKMRSGVFVPVTHNGHAHGMLGIFSHGASAIDAEEVRFAESIGNVLSTALQREKAEQRLAFLAQFDSLTGLPNRSLLEDRLEQTMAQSRRMNRHAAVLLVDLDRFKMVNDTLGHQAGDLMIREVGRRLEQCVRAGDTVSRISGDEFAVVLADLALGDHAGAVAQKVLDSLAAPFDLDGSEAFVTASIGISVHPADGDEPNTLLRSADMAMYKAKKTERNCYRFFTAKMNERTVAKLQLNTDLRHAIERSEFALHYQPKIDLQAGVLTGVEALLRWSHPQRGLVSPAEFIPALEDSGLILPVGEWVIDEACGQIRRWQLAGLKPVPVAINLSAKQFRRQDLDGVIQRALRAAGLPSALLELEITESSLADDSEDAVRILSNLREAGMKISVDDFGTGYSSLAYLTRLPLSALKIDRSFVRDAVERPAAASIVRAIIDMAHNLDFTVIAEGVETEWQAKFLRLHKCDQAQGYLYGRPVAATELASRLSRAVSE